MLAADKTVTVVRYADAVYTCTTLQDVSWFEKLQVNLQDKGLVAVNIFKIRIPADSLPEDFLPQVGDFVIQGQPSGDIQKASDLTQYHYFTVKGVGDNRRKPSRLPHVAVTGA